MADCSDTLSLPCALNLKEKASLSEVTLLNDTLVMNWPLSIFSVAGLWLSQYPSSSICLYYLKDGDFCLIFVCCLITCLRAGFAIVLDFLLNRMDLKTFIHFGKVWPCQCVEVPTCWYLVRCPWCQLVCPSHSFVGLPITTNRDLQNVVSF